MQITRVAKGLLVGLLGLLASPVWAANVSFQTGSASSSNTGLNVAPNLTFSHTVNAGSNLLLLVGCTTTCATSCPTTATATFNGDSMTLTQRQAGSTAHTVFTFHLVNPDVTTGNVVIDPDNDQRITCGAITADNVHQTVPFGTISTGNLGATSNTRTITVPFRGAGYATLGKNNSTEALVITSGTEIWSNVTTNGTAANNVQTKGAIHTVPGSQTFTITSTTSRNLVITALPIRNAISRRVLLGEYYLGE